MVSKITGVPITRLTEGERDKVLNLNKNERLVRLHIGLEDPKDLIADLKQALKHIK